MSIILFAQPGELYNSIILDHKNEIIRRVGFTNSLRCMHAKITEYMSNGGLTRAHYRICYFFYELDPILQVFKCAIINPYCSAPGNFEIFYRKSLSRQIIREKIAKFSARLPKM